MLRKEDELLIGGQAVIEGVMMRSKNKVCMAVKSANGDIIIEKENINSLTEKNKIFGLPFIRGIIILFETLYLGIKLLYHSANYAAKTEKEKISKKELIVSFIISLIIAILVFVMLPYYITEYLKFKNNFLFNFIDGIIKIIFFVLYVIFISFFKDVRRIFEFHGAEHKVVNTFENKESIELPNIKKYSTFHKRCGTSFIFFVLLISIFIFALIPPQSSKIIKVLMRIILIPVIAGISYEVLKFTARLKIKWLSNILTLPGLLIQKITTKEPNEEQINIAIIALKGCLEND
ncbi:MAG TPA: DUF1385 domain-containing protein [bacterium]|nr:DUF1385 domain-containing protein [bacterium]HOL47498.1 DUF1385 domain-containing protein [bacterium]HPQ19580.1 DUF1385 domain-containing protein [bacterium]